MFIFSEFSLAGDFDGQRDEIFNLRKRHDLGNHFSIADFEFHVRHNRISDAQF